MKIHTTVLAAALTGVLAAFSLQALACSTVIVGKAASATGNILVGHNEDNGGRIFNPQYYVPPAAHKAGEMITFEPAAAKIPQVAKTLGFYWSQTLSSKGSSFSDGFVNDAGVIIVSNACTGIYDNDQKLTDGGIGYGIRRLMAERAHSAREAIQIAIDLLGKYGYFSEGRTYTVADAKEAWQIAIHKGDTWVARRVKDNEVVYIPNNFMIGVVDATDKDNVIVSPGLIERSIKNGRYKPAKPGVYSDFNFRLAVQPPERRAAQYNFSRNQLAWNYILGQKITDPESFPYSAAPSRKFSLNDVKAILRLHEEKFGAEDDGWMHYRGFGTCRATSHESLVLEQNKIPQLISGYRTFTRPCESPYIPFFPLARPDSSLSYMTPAEAAAEQFHALDKRFDYRPSYGATPFVDNANAVDYLAGDAYEANRKMIAKLESRWEGERASMIEKARKGFVKSSSGTMKTLHRFNSSKLLEAQKAVKEQLRRITPWRVKTMSRELDPTSDAPVVFVLFSRKGFDATKIDKERTWAGLSRESITNGRTLSESTGKAAGFEEKDMNGDGLPDMVITFRQKDVAKNMLPGVEYDTYLYTRAGDTRITGFDVLRVKGETRTSIGK
ncbi:C69 family dipeptidase [Mesosutterella sp. OilRF-GAM-744-9]|uniref:C69 family dipeptidase n=1 Tax=Mesosutterella porci TaxID=2915351 RepID=A0ABS9MNY9_9BURK|nr:C69 family dipeptidase [Mesosutterella sp. oilRF-744-WT-GAM-9]MCG5030097.1 C69 family dipeptidase [Mesosutterella sp. oilRF-744-WT-GAM-9]